VKLRQGGLEIVEGAHDLLGLLGVIPKTGGGGVIFQIGDPLRQLGNVKDSPGFFPGAR